MTNKEIIKHSAAVQISNYTTLLQRRTWNVLLGNAYWDLPTKDRYSIAVRDLMGLLDLEESHNDKHIKDLCLGLINIVVQWNILKKDNKIEWGASGLLASAKIENGVLTYSYSSELRERLYSPEMYARINLKLQNKFNSKYSLAIYELCIDYFMEKIRRGETPWININVFRFMMGLSNETYSRFKDFSLRIIKPSIKEINEKSDLDVEVEFKREKRKIVALKFVIKPKGNREHILLGLSTHQPSSSDSKADGEDLSRRLVTYFCLSEAQAKEILDRFDLKDIETKLARIEEDYRNGKIRNIGSYTYKALMEVFIYEPTPFEAEKAQQMEEQKRVEEQRLLIEELQNEFWVAREKEGERIANRLTEEEIEENIGLFEAEVIGKQKGLRKLYKERGGLQSKLFLAQFHDFLALRYLPPHLVDLVAYAKSKGIDLDPKQLKAMQ